MKLGVLRPTCRQAASATGPMEQCGATRRSCAGGHRGDLLARQQAAAVGQVHLHHVGGAQRDQPVEVRQRVQPLARRDRGCAPALDLGQQVQALRRHRLLAPGRVEALQPRGSSRMAAPADSRPWNSIISPTSRPDRLAHRRDASQRRPPPARRQVLPGGAERVELHRAVAARDRRRAPARRTPAGVRAPPYQPLA